jgi:hypothetical protein
MTLRCDVETYLSFIQRGSNIYGNFLQTMYQTLQRLSESYWIWLSWAQFGWVCQSLMHPGYRFCTLLPSSNPVLSLATDNIQCGSALQSCHDKDVHSHIILEFCVKFPKHCHAIADGKSKKCTFLACLNVDFRFTIFLYELQVYTLELGESSSCKNASGDLSLLWHKQQNWTVILLF